MTVWDEVVGQPDAVAALQRAAAMAEDVLAGRGPGPAHAWLVTGPPGSGRSVAARAFAAALQCDRGGCGECHECTTVLKGTHADVQVVVTEGLTIDTESTRYLVLSAQRYPSRGRWRVVIVEDADRMHERAFNVLLKSIEEPPPRTIWVLCAPSPEDVLVTIRSRCRALRLRLPAVQDVADLLVRRDGVDPAMAAFAARAAQSHVGMARRLARDETVRNRRHEVVSIPFELSGVTDAVLQAGALVEIAGEEATAATAERDAAERVALLHSLGADEGGALPRDVRSQVKQLETDQKRRATRYRRDVLDRSLLDLLSVYRDVLLLQLGADVDLVNAPLRAQLVKLADSSTPEQTLRRMDAIGEARERIGLNVNPLLAVEAMALQLLPSG
ncbi:MAG: DNA polymerase III subunit delta' [Actinomycetes bacterium]